MKTFVLFKPCHKLTKPNALIVKLCAVLLLLLSNVMSAQKVGVVLSGGGAGGLAHVGVLKALEEKGIPIDYITGTSIGALVGGLYAAGYSPEELEQLFRSERFRNFAKGEIENKYQFYFKKSDDNASWFSYKLSIDTSLLTSIPTHVMNSVPIDFYMMEMFASPSAAAGYNFDSLLIPFRCVASDIETKSSVVFDMGNLSTAIRASMTYPFYFSPIQVDGKLLFDGGLYNNFPSNVMNSAFNPDFIIGSVVTDNAPNPNDENLYLQLRSMLMTKTDFDPACEQGVLIKPWSDVGIFTFEKAQALIDSGYAATLRKLEQLRSYVSATRNKEQVSARRQHFRKKQKEMVFEEIDIDGLGKKQAQYVKKLFYTRHHELNLERLRPRYFRLAEDDKIKSIFPTAIYNPLSGKYKLHLRIKKQKDMAIQLGGNFSNLPISEGFIGLQYNYLSKVALTIYGNAYFGRLNSSLYGKIRLDMPSHLPFYIEPAFTYSTWDYFRSSTLFFDFQKPPYLTQRDVFGETSIGFPFGNRAKMVFNSGLAELNNIYYQTDNFTEKDTADRTYFDFIFGKAEYELNTLNRKQYASEGTLLSISAKYVSGLEFYKPGSTSQDTLNHYDSLLHSWYQIKTRFETYLKTTRHFKVGIFGEGVFSTQSFFRNYNSSVLSAPAFMPTPQSKTLFLEKFRAHKYLAGGVKMIINPVKNLDIRFEGYVFQPVQSIIKDDDLKAKYSTEFLYRYLTGMAAMVYHTPLGPASVSVNYYYKEKQPFSFLVHFGYTIFNKKSIE